MQELGKDKKKYSKAYYASAINLGHVYLALNKYEQAEKYLNIAQESKFGYYIYKPLLEKLSYFKQYELAKNKVGFYDL